MINESHRLDLPDSDIWYVEDFYSAQTADDLYQLTIQECAWRSDNITLFGKTHAIPRLHAFYGDSGLRYHYSGITNEALAWTPALQKIRNELKQKTGYDFNALLANYYRDGNDSNGWHADDEAELGWRPVIASLSFGTARDFQLRHNLTRERIDIHLKPGSLLIMAGNTQSLWQHCLPKRKRCKSGRVNLTFRNITHAT